MQSDMLYNLSKRHAYIYSMSRTIKYIFLTMKLERTSIAIEVAFEDY